MADFTKDGAADIAAGNTSVHPGTSGVLRAIDWGTEDAYWRAEYASRPYARADRGYAHFEPAYRYGVESRTRHEGREWREVERDLESGWPAYRGRSQAAWAEIRDAVRDAFHGGRWQAGGVSSRG
jgi:hypothetical protein